MTTIAYRDGVLAADEAEEREGAYLVRCNKLHTLVAGPMKGCAVAEVGCGDGCMRIIKELSTKQPEPFEHEETATIVVMWPDGRVEEYGPNMTAYPVTAEFCAWGSGAQIAMGAMAHGATAVQAIQAAAKLNPGTRLYGRKVPHLRAKKWTESQ